MPLPNELCGLRTLAARGPLADDDWCALLEARHRLIAPQLDRFTLPSLGTFQCLKTESHWTRQISCFVSNTTGDSRFSLETQGLFGYSWSSREETSPDRHVNMWYAQTLHPADGCLRIWGLTRKGNWIIATVVYVGEEGYKGRGAERATEIGIREVTIQELVAQSKCHPREIWRALGKRFHELVQIRRAQYENAREIAAVMNTEEQLEALIEERLRKAEHGDHNEPASA